MNFFGNKGLEIPDQLKEIVKHSSEAELTELVMQSLKEALRDPDQFAKAFGDLPPFLANSLKHIPNNEATLRPMAQMMAGMLIQQVKHGKPANIFDMQAQMQQAMKNPESAAWMNSVYNEYQDATQAEEVAPKAIGQSSSSSIPDEVKSLMDQSVEFRERDEIEAATEHALLAALACARECPDSPTMCYVLDYVNDLLLDQEKFALAEPNVKKCLQLAEKVLPSNHSVVASSYSGLGRIRASQNKIDDADLLFTKAVNVGEKAFASEPDDLADLIEHAALFYEAQKRYRKSDPLFQRAFSLREQAFGQKDLDVAEQAVRYALALEARENFNDAEMWCYRALQIKHDLMEKNNPDLARNQVLLASIYIGKQEFDKAEPILKESIKIIEESSDAEDLLYPLQVLSRMLHASGREDEAKEIDKTIAAKSESDSD